MDLSSFRSSFPCSVSSTFFPGCSGSSRSSHIIRSWTTQVISNVALATEAGVYGTEYFSLPNVRARHVASGSFRRAMTYSFGSIAEGSLIVAFLDLLRAALSLIQNQEAASGDMFGAIMACIASCCVGCVRGLVD